jgi:hypothetical protein
MARTNPGWRAASLNQASRLKPRAYLKALKRWFLCYVPLLNREVSVVAQRVHLPSLFSASSAFDRYARALVE